MDSREECAEILLRDNPDPFRMLCLHVYPKEDNKYPAEAVDLTDVVRTMQTISLKAGKPLFIGEFGAPLTLGQSEERRRFLEIVNAIEASKVPLSAFWVFDHARQDKNWNVTFDNNRHYMLKVVAETNQRMKADSP